MAGSKLQCPACKNKNSDYEGLFECVIVCSGEVDFNQTVTSIIPHTVELDLLKMMTCRDCGLTMGATGFMRDETDMVKD